MKTITKEAYITFLLTSKAHYQNQDVMDLEAIDSLNQAIESAKNSNFEEVEVVAPQDETQCWTFQPIFLNKEAIKEQDNE